MKRFSILFLVLIGLKQVYGQSNQTLYHMVTLPQVMTSNPANTPDSKVFFGFPGLSSLYGQASISGLNLGAIDSALVPIPGTDSFDFDINKLSHLFGKRTFMQINAHVEILHFGFTVNKSLFTISVSEKVKFRMEFPQAMFRLMFEGNGGANLGESFSMDVSADLQHYREFAFGYQRTLLDDRLTLGARVKYLYGLNVLETSKNDLVFTTEEDDFGLSFEADLEYNAASSLIGINDSNFKSDVAKYLIGNGNSGWGLDLGVGMQVSDKLNLSLGITDIGYINWEYNTFNLRSRQPGAKLTFRGFDAEQFFHDSVNFDSAFKELGDSMREIFALDTTRNTFSTTFIPEIYLGASYQLSKRIGLGLLGYFNFYNKKLYPMGTVSVNTRLSPAFAASLSYTVARGSYSNIGFGMSLNMGKAQVYFVSDNLYGLFKGSIQNIGMRFGINFTLKRTVKEDLFPETPPEEMDPKF